MWALQKCLAYLANYYLVTHLSPNVKREDFGGTVHRWLSDLLAVCPPRETLALDDLASSLDPLDLGQR